MKSLLMYNQNGDLITRMYQWDKSQAITVKGLPVSPLPEFRFSNINHQTEITVVPTVIGTDMTAIVPDSLLEEPTPIHAYIYRPASTGAIRTLGEIIVDVLPRRNPREYTDSEI